MKLFPAIQTKSKRARLSGFTLAEIMICSAIFVMLVTAIVETQIFGLQVYTLAATKLTATAGGRKALNMIRDQVREAKIVDVGIYTNSAATFYFIGPGTNQIGNALIIFPTTNTAYGTIFFKDQTIGNLCSVYITNGSYSTNGLVFTGTTSGLATNVPFITNYFVFDTENYQGTVLTNKSNNRIIHMTLQFYQWEYPVAGAGNGAMYDYYELHTRVTRRAID